MSETDTEIKQTNPEVAKAVNLNGIRTNYHDLGAGFPVMLIHGSGPGVSAWANWRLAMPGLSKVARVIAPDMFNSGSTPTVPLGLQSFTLLAEANTLNPEIAFSSFSNGKYLSRLTPKLTSLSLV